MKAALITSLFVTFFAFQFACTQENDEARDAESAAQSEEEMAPAETTGQNLAANASGESASGDEGSTSSGPGIYEMTSVSPADGGKVPNFTWKENGRSKSLHDLIDGKVALINFWGVWCPPCRMEIPDLIELNEELSGGEFVMLGIALGRGKIESVSNVQKFVDAKGINYVNFIGTMEAANAFGGITSVPSTFIVNKDGKIVDTIIGARDKAAFQKAVDNAK